MIAVPDIGQQGARVGQGRRSKDAAQEPEDEDGCRVFRERAADLHANVRDERADKHGSSSVRLGERAPEQGADAIPGDEEGDRQNRHFLRELKVLDHVLDNA